MSDAIKADQIRAAHICDPETIRFKINHRGWPYYVTMERMSGEVLHLKYFCFRRSALVYKDNLHRAYIEGARDMLYKRIILSEQIAAASISAGKL